jgi:recombination protein RecT
MNVVATTATRQPNLPEVIAAIESRRAQLASLLPADVPLESFISHFKTAAMRTNGLLECTPKSVVLAIMQAANDGLMPDGREAAIIVYNRKDKASGRWLKEAQYQQMYLGILKRIRAAGEVVKIEARVVHAEDHFDYAYGDDGYIVHKPALKAEVGPIIAVYAIVTFRDGTRQHEVMSAHEVLAIRERSKGWNSEKPDGPWHTDFGEMAKKTVLKRLGKILPQARGRAAISGDADDSGAEEEVDIYPELGTPEPQEKAPEAPAVDATSRIVPEALGSAPAHGPDVTQVVNRKIDGEKQGATEADEVVFWKAQLKKLRAALHVVTTLQGAEDAYNDWSAEYETIPDDVMVEVSRLCTRRTDQIKASLANHPTGPSDYQKMKDAE